MALFGTSWDDPQTQAILALGAGLLGGGSFGQSLGRGATGAMQAYQQAQQAKQQQAQEEQRRQMAEMQMQEQRAAMQEREQQREQAKQLQGIYKQSFAPQTDGADFMRNTMAGDYGTPSQSQRPNMQQGLQAAQQAMIAQGFIPEALGLQKTLGDLHPTKKVKDWKPLMVGGVQKMVPLFEDGSVGTPGEYENPVEMKFQDLGGSVAGVNPFTGQVGAKFGKSMTPGEMATDRRANERMQFDRGQTQKPIWSAEAGGFVLPMSVANPTGLVVAPAGFAGKSTPKKEAEEALALISQAEALLPNATGSYLGKAVDMGAQVFGASTDGAMATRQLQALEGALVAKMPKMTGPQSDKDVLLYRQMAATVGDPTIPVAERQAALEVVREIQERYAGLAPGASKLKPQSWGKPGKSTMSAGGWSATEIR